MAHEPIPLPALLLADAVVVDAPLTSMSAAPARTTGILLSLMPAVATFDVELINVLLYVFVCLLRLLSVGAVTS